MKVKVKLLQNFLDRAAMTAADLAREIGLIAPEIETLLRGEAVGRTTAAAVVDYFGVDYSTYLIDWDAMGRPDPLACEADEIYKNKGGGDNGGD